MAKKPKDISAVRREREQRDKWIADRKRNPVRPLTVSPPEDLGNGWWRIDGVIVHQDRLQS